MWSILPHIHPVHTNRQLTSHYITYERDINVEGETVPTPVCQVAHLEKNNNFSLNVFGSEQNEENVCPIYNTKRKQNTYKSIILNRRWKI